MLNRLHSPAGVPAFAQVSWLSSTRTEAGVHRLFLPVAVPCWGKGFAANRSAEAALVNVHGTAVTLPDALSILCDNLCDGKFVCLSRVSWRPARQQPSRAVISGESDYPRLREACLGMH